MSSENIEEEPKRIEEPQRQERSVRDLLVNQVRRLIPSTCSVRAQEGGTTSEQNTENTVPKAQIPRCSTQNSEPNITVLHVRASVQRTTPVFHRPPDFSEQVLD